jgi:hypothetical protein
VGKQSDNFKKADFKKIPKGMYVFLGSENGPPV